MGWRGREEESAHQERRPGSPTFSSQRDEMKATRTMSRSIGKPVVFRIVVIAIILSATGFVVFRSVVNGRAIAQRAAHGRDVLDALGTLMRVVDEAEAGHRGYLLTGDESYLETYRSAPGAVDRSMSILESLIQDPIPQRKLMKLKPAVADLLTELAESREIRGRDGFDAALKAVRGSQEKQRLADIQKSVREMEDDERTLLSREAEAAAANVRGTTVTVCILGVILFCAVFGLVERERVNSALERENARLVEEAIIDGLTGLCNRPHFEEAMESSLARANKANTALSMVLFDLDGFKAYNTSYGHKEGNEVLCLVADLIQAQARKHDLVARFGGGQFAILLPGSDARIVRLVGERLRAAIERQPWSLRPITASFGVATVTPEVTSGQVLLKQAEQALARSKDGGRNCVTHHEDPLSKASENVAELVG